MCSPDECPATRKHPTNTTKQSTKATPTAEEPLVFIQYMNIHIYQYSSMTCTSLPVFVNVTLLVVALPPSLLVRPPPPPFSFFWTSLAISSLLLGLVGIPAVVYFIFSFSLSSRVNGGSQLFIPTRVFFCGAFFFVSTFLTERKERAYFRIFVFSNIFWAG